MEFRETLLAAQRNQQQQSSSNYYYKAKFDPPKKEQKQKDRLSANIQKFLDKKDEEERQKKLEAQRKKEELLAMRDPKALRKIQKSLKVIKSANKSVLEDAVDRDNTAVTLEGTELPDQDDYGYESQEAAALYAKMMQKYSKIPEKPKFPTGNNFVKKDLNGTRERVKNALQREDEPVPHKRRRKGGTGERDESPPSKYEPEKEKKKEEQTKTEKPKIRKPAPPPMDFNQLLKLAEQKKSEPIDVVAKKVVPEQKSETERLMTKKQKREYEEELARRQKRQERLEAEKGGKKIPKEEERRPVEKERKQVPSGFGRIPKVGERNPGNSRNDSPKPSSQDKNKLSSERDRLQREKERARLDKERAERERERLDKEIERLDRLKAERERIDRDIERLNRDREKLEKTKARLGTSIQSEKNRPLDKSIDRNRSGSGENGRQDLKKNIDLKSQNTYRIDKNSNERKISIPSKDSNGKYLNGDSAHGKPVPKLSKEQTLSKNAIKERELLVKQKMQAANGSIKTNGKLDSTKRPVDSAKGLQKRPDDRNLQSKLKPGSSEQGKPKNTGSFDFDKHMNSLGKNGRQPSRPDDAKRRPHPDDRRKPKRRLDSDSEYDSEMDDFIDDEDENLDYSRHIKEIFGYDKSKYRDIDDDDDPTMESSFARQQREEYISKKIGILEDLEDMRMEAMENKKKKKRRISDD